MLLLDVAEDVDEDERGYYVSDATLITEARPIHDFVDCVESGVAKKFTFDFGRRWEDFTYDAALERKDQKVQPLTGKVSKNGKNYIGGHTWDDFGVDGITGTVEIHDPDTADPATDDESSEHTDHDAPSDHNKLLREAQGKMESQTSNEPTWVSKPKEIATSPTKPKDSAFPSEGPKEAGAGAPEGTAAAKAAEKAPGYHTPPKVRFADPAPSASELAEMVKALTAVVHTQQDTIRALEKRVAALEMPSSIQPLARHASQTKAFGLTPEDAAILCGEGEGEGSGGARPAPAGFTLDGLEDLLNQDAAVPERKPARGTKRSQPSTTPASFGVTADDLKVFTGRKLDPRKCEDDASTDSDDSEVQAYRQRMASKGQAVPKRTPAKYKCEDDDSTDSDDSEAREYRARMAAKAGAQPAARAKPAEYKCEDDDSTDSDDSEAREYRARMAAKKADAADSPAVKVAAAPKAGADTPEAKMAAKKAAEDALIAEAAAITDEDWTCSQCKGFNWADATVCVHCGHTSRA